MVMHDIATSCRELLSSTTLPDDLPTALKQLLQVCVCMVCSKWRNKLLLIARSLNYLEIIEFVTI